MKKFKGLAAIITAAALAVGSAGTALAAASPQSQPSLSGLLPSATAAPAEEQPAAEQPVADTPVADYPKLKYSDKRYNNDQSVYMGRYPSIDGMTSLNVKIVDTIWRNYSIYSEDPEYSSDVNAFVVSYNVEEAGQYSKITLTLNYKRQSTDVGAATDTFTYYVNKADYTELTEEAYTKAIEALEPVDETEDPTDAAAGDDIPAEMIPLRANTDILGYTLAWNAEDKSIDVLKGEDVIVTVKIGENAYGTDENGEVIKLDSAPTLSENGVTFVPASFFPKILKAELGKDAIGSTVVKKR
jgi:hypothetical protein